MISETELAALLYRADWTTLSLAARAHRVTGHTSVHSEAPPGMPPGPRPPWAGPGAGGPGPRSRRDSTSDLLIAPGCRYRVHHDGSGGEPVAEGFDGESCWLLAAPLGEGETLEMFSTGGPEPPLPALLCPDWLLRGFAVAVTGETAVAGRPAWRSGPPPRPPPPPGRPASRPTAWKPSPTPGWASCCAASRASAAS